MQNFDIWYLAAQSSSLFNRQIELSNFEDTMDAFDVQIYRADTKSLVHLFNPSQSPFASYNRGDFLDLRPQGKGVWEIQTIGFAVIENGSNRVHRTSLVVNALSRPLKALGDDDAIPWA